MYANLYAPNGAMITGTREIIPGTCAILEGTARADPNGGFDFDWCGETDIDWDSQETVTRLGKRVFIDDDGGEWTEDQLQLREDDEDEESSDVPDETVLRGAHALEGSNGSFDAWTASVAAFKGHPLHNEARRFLNLEDGQ